MTGSTHVTDVNTWAAILTGCLIEGEGAFAFCCVHEENGCPLWNECRWTEVAEALRAAWTAGREVERARASAALAAVERVRRFVDGFAARGGGKLDPGDELWIMAIRRELGEFS